MYYKDSQFAAALARNDGRLSKDALSTSDFDNDHDYNTPNLSHNDAKEWATTLQSDFSSLKPELPIPLSPEGQASLPVMIGLAPN
ncbi:hypothetical protein ANO14919_038290 [Xylariales sp. No.14919]|nr:hypothetical protein ANO14919_038290 [Xylariales sp. No.14919]